MNHLSDEELILHYYGETGRADRSRVEDHLAACGECQTANTQLGRVLQLVETMPMPDPGPGFDRDVWVRLAPRLDANAGGWRVWLSGHRLALAGGVAALVVMAFAAGRFSGGTTIPAAGSGAQAADASERVLRAAVGDHLDRSQMMLVELVNADDDSRETLAGEQSRAAELVSTNRLFRQSAEQSGDTAIADILDDLERVLLEIANAPADGMSGGRTDVKSRIETEDLLFRVRVIASEMRQRTRRDGGSGEHGAQRPPIS